MTISPTTDLKNDLNAMRSSNDLSIGASGKYFYLLNKTVIETGVGSTVAYYFHSH
jgi:hypothetical protein